MSKILRNARIWKASYVSQIGQFIPSRDVIVVEGAKNATGLDIDAATGGIFIAVQDSDNLLVVDRETGKVLQNVTVGASAPTAAVALPSGS